LLSYCSRKLRGGIPGLPAWSPRYFKTTISRCDNLRCCPRKLYCQQCSPGFLCPHIKLHSRLNTLPPAACDSLAVRAATTQGVQYCVAVLEVLADMSICLRSLTPAIASRYTCCIAVHSWGRAVVTAYTCCHVQCAQHAAAFAPLPE
jgi:hypothetical protein